MNYARLPAVVLLLLFIGASIGCTSSPLREYELTSIGLVTMSDAMVAAKQNDLIDKRTLELYDAAATPVEEGVIAWGRAIVEEYGKPKDKRNFARIDSLGNIAVAGWKGLKSRFASFIPNWKEPE